MPPPSKKAKGNLNHVDEISEIYRAENCLKSTGSFENQNRLISSTPSTDRHISLLKNENRTGANISSFHGAGDSALQDASSSDSSPVRKKRSLEESFTTTAHLEGSRSLFTNFAPRYPVESLQKGTRFNLEAFMNNSSSKKVKEEQVNSSTGKSPFYMGQTMFGGASSASYLAATEKLTSSIQLQNQSSSKSAIRIQPIIVNAQNSTTNQMSQTARRILSTLEQFAKPISEPTKLNVSPTPALVQNAKRFGHLDRSLNRSRDSNDQSPILANKPYARTHLNTSNTCFQKELQVATVPELLKILHKNKLQKSTLAARKLATTSTSELIKPNPAYKLRTEQDEKYDNKSATKVKTKISGVRQSKHILDLEETVPVLKLPSAQLNITTMPKFDINLPQQLESSNTNEKQLTTSKKESNINILVEAKKTSDKTSPEKVLFSFSYPSRFPQVPKSQMDVESNHNYEFHDPEKMNSKSDPSKLIKSLLNSCRENEINKPHNLSNNKNWQWECNVCCARSFSNMSQCVCCGELKKGSEKVISFDLALSKNTTSVTSASKSFQDVSNRNEDSKCKLEQNKCTSISTVKVNTIDYVSHKENVDKSYQGVLKEQSKKWECKECLTRNNFEQSKCVCCETPKVQLSNKLSNENTTQILNSNSFQDLIKKQNAKWECNQCLTRNNPEQNRCACCEALKTIPADNVSERSVNTFSNSFQDVMKKQNTKWECNQCLTRNDLEKNTCICCEAQRYSKSSLANKPTTKAMINIGKGCATTSNNSFADLVKKQNQKWECSGCMTHNDQHKTKCACCEAPKPGTLNEKNQFKFSSIPVTEFKFGMDKASDCADKPDAAKLFELTSTSTTLKDSTITATSTNTNQTFSFGMPVPNKLNEIKKEEKEIESKANIAGKVPAAGGFVFGLPQNSLLQSSLQPKITSGIESTSNKQIFQFGSSSKESITSTAVSAGFSILPSIAQTINSNTCNINSTTVVSTNNSTIVSTTTSSASSLFSFGSNPSSLAFNGNGASLNKADNSAKVIPSLKPQQAASSLFKIQDKTGTVTDDGEPSSKKPSFVFNTNISNNNPTPSAFGTTLKSPFTQNEQKPQKDVGFQYTSTSSTDQKKPFSFTSSSLSEKPGLFVFGDTGSINNTASSTPFEFGTSAQSQTNLGFDTNKSNNLQSTASTNIFGSTQAVANTQSNNIFGSNTALNTSSSMFSFGSQSSTPQGPAIFTFGTNTKPAVGDSNTSGFKFELNSNVASIPQANSSLSFGTDVKAFPTVQFQMGSVGPSEGRKIKKAVRRAPR